MKQRDGIRRRLAAVAAVLAAAGAVPVRGDVINHIVLRINERIATLQDFELRRAQMLADLGQADLDDETRRKALSELAERVYRDMFEELLLQSRADQLAIQVSDKTLQEVMKNIREDMGVPDEAAFEVALAQSGMTVPEFRERWRENLRMREVVGVEVTGRIVSALNEDAMRRIYRDQPERFRSPARVRLRELVVLDEGSLDAAAKQALAARLQAALTAGEGVDELVAEHQAAGYLSGLIDLGWVRPGELAANLEQVAFNLPVGGVSTPVAGRGGLHVLQVLERQESQIQPFEEVVGDIQRQERERLFPQRYREYLAELEAGSHIVLRPPPGASGFRRVEGSVAEEVKDGPVPAVEEEVPAAPPGAAGEPAAGYSPPAEAPPAVPPSR